MNEVVDRPAPLRIRSILLLAVASAALYTSLPSAPAAAGESPARLHLAATVLARALLDSERLPRQLVITQQDLVRGYVELEEPVEVAFRSNHPRGVMLGFALSSLSIASVEAQAFEEGRPLSAGSAIHVPQRVRGFRPHKVSLRLRLRLAPAAVSGTVPFPVHVTLTPTL